MPEHAFDPPGQMQESISDWLRRLRAGETDAIQLLWDTYSRELVQLAKRRLGATPSGIADEEDVALSVFGSICRGAAEGRFEKVSSRDELWWLLLRITKQKAVDHIRREAAEKRGGRHEQQSLEGNAGHLGARISLDDLISPCPTPDFLVALEEQSSRLLSLLRDDRLRQIAVLRIEGYTDKEIAERMSIGLRAIERKLQLIRAKWTTELVDSDSGQ